MNLPSITISKLNQSRLVQRIVSSVGSGNETYSVGWSAPYGVSVNVKPNRFIITSGEKQVLNISFVALANNTVASFGRIGLFGDHGHVVNIPLSVILKISYNVTNDAS